MEISTQRPSAQPRPHPEPRWPAVVAVFVAAAVHFALPRSLVFGPPWMTLGTVTILVLITIESYRRGRHVLSRRAAYLTYVILTGALLFGVGVLVGALPRHAETPAALLRSAAVLWFSNVLVFALWYWRLDAGGPTARDHRTAHTRGAFLFPQMAIDARDGTGRSMAEATVWRPDFIDYLFLAFNTSTAFSPTDTTALSAWAKLMMLVQSLISLSTIAVLAARAINTL